MNQHRLQILERNLNRVRKAHKLVSYIGAELGPKFDPGDSLIHLEILGKRIEQAINSEAMK